MLELPSKGFYVSVNEHNVRFDILVDWIEGCITFSDDVLSQSDVIDVLCENGIYREQDYAAEMVGNAWEELRRRLECIGDGRPFKVISRRLHRIHEWNLVPAYSFCLTLSLKECYPTWAKSFGNDYTQQGDLFERLTVECLDHLGWETLRTGWDPAHPAKIKEVVAAVADHIGEPEMEGEVEKWMSKGANEEGLDVVCSDPFYDGRGGRPLFFFQCASGTNWDDKLHTPSLEVWHRVISYTTRPQRGFSVPFALLEDDFQRSAGRINGMFLDRYRLLAPSYEGEIGWTSKDLHRKLNAWLRPRIKKLPQADA
ncbi:MAG: hypothetical protein IID44_07455 [Planctomycetes bacterium]|nr:hypothetical protein [Planctomycetota bacterium]